MRHESGAEEVERNKRIQNMMMRPSEIQTAFRFAAYGFLGNPLHTQGVLFMMEFPNKLTAENAPVARFFVSTPIICLPHFRFLGCDRFQVMGVRVAAMPRTLL